MTTPAKQPSPGASRARKQASRETGAQRRGAAFSGAAAANSRTLLLTIAHPAVMYNDFYSSPRGERGFCGE